VLKYLYAYTYHVLVVLLLASSSYYDLKVIVVVVRFALFSKEAHNMYASFICAFVSGSYYYYYYYYYFILCLAVIVLLGLVPTSKNTLFRS
jgi:hypothetical protein